MKIKIVLGDITKANVDVIVNAANSLLIGGCGVDGAIHSAGGPAIGEECNRIFNSQGKCNPGNIVVTNAGKLSAKYIIHTVGPDLRNKSEVDNAAVILHKCYVNSLLEAKATNAKSIAFPCISTGVYRYPSRAAAKVVIETLTSPYFYRLPIDVYLVCFDKDNLDALQAELKTATNTYHSLKRWWVDWGVNNA
jgi:O-acetyl-ADP-ribose deacetylase (regulator of RNase III)